MSIQVSSGAFLARHAETALLTALLDTPIVALIGPRQSGKTTLARRIAEQENRVYITLDDEQYREFAQEDPKGFLRSQQNVVIDEIQRVPDLILALKQDVDENPRPGRYLITGSVDLFRSTVSPDSLAGRVETIELLPLSQAEVEERSASQFLDRAFDCDFPSFLALGSTRDLIERVVSGGYPAVFKRTLPARRQTWLRSYARTFTERDITEIFNIGKRSELNRFLDQLALTAGQLVNLSRLGATSGVDANTIDRWLVLLEQLFLTQRIPAWHRNELKRLVKTPKVHFLDSGLLAALTGVSLPAIKSNRDRLGMLLETFVYAELAKSISLSEERTTISHFRDKDGYEVDFVIERMPSSVVGVEVKASATVRPRDYRGLKRLEKVIGDQFSCGIILHDGDRVQQTAPKMFAMPFKMLWEA